MNVLEATRKLDKLSDTISALSNAADYLRGHQDHYSARLLDELQNSFQEEANELRVKLEKIVL